MLRTHLIVLIMLLVTLLINFLPTKQGFDGNKLNQTILLTFSCLAGFD